MKDKKTLLVGALITLASSGFAHAQGISELLYGQRGRVTVVQAEEQNQTNSDDSDSDQSDDQSVPYNQPRAGMNFQPMGLKVKIPNPKKIKIPNPTKIKIPQPQPPVKIKRPDIISPLPMPTMIPKIKIGRPPVPDVSSLGRQLDLKLNSEVGISIQELQQIPNDIKKSVLEMSRLPRECKRSIIRMAESDVVCVSAVIAAYYTGGVIVWLGAGEACSMANEDSLQMQADCKEHIDIRTKRTAGAKGKAGGNAGWQGKGGNGNYGGSNNGSGNSGWPVKGGNSNSPSNDENDGETEDDNGYWQGNFQPGTNPTYDQTDGFYK